MKIRIEDLNLKSNRDSREQIVGLLEDFAVDAQEVANMLQTSRPTAVYHLKRMEAEGLVCSVMKGRLKLYYIPGDD